MRIFKDIVPVVNTVGNPGSNTNLVSEKGIRAAMGVAGIGTGLRGPAGPSGKDFDPGEGSGAGLENKIVQGDTHIEVIDTGDGYITFVEDGTELMRITDGTIIIGDTYSYGTHKLDVDGTVRLRDDVTIEGNVDAGIHELTIGSINRANGLLTLEVGGVTQLQLSAENMKIKPAGDIVLDPVGNDIYPSVNYDLNLGLINKKFLTLHCAELWVETLVAQETIATIGGRILVGPTTILTSDIAPADTTIYVKHNQMISGDRVYMEAGGFVEFMAITSGASGEGPYSYTVTRDLDGTGANDWYAGDAIFNTGQAGNGFIDLYSIRGVRVASQHGPAIVGNVRNSAVYNDWTEAWAIGNLNGIYGFGVDTYGVGFGKYSAADYVTIEPVNGVRFLDSDDHVWAQLAGNMWTLGRTDYEHIRITAASIQIKDGANVYTHLASGILKLGLVSGGQYLRVDWTGIKGYCAGVKHLEVTSAGIVKLGYVSGGEYLQIDSTSIKGYSGAAKRLEITSAGSIFLGDQTSRHVKITSASGVMIYDGDILRATYGTIITIGQTSDSHILISEGELQLRKHTVPKITLSSDGNIQISGSMVIGTTGNIMGGQTGYAYGTGFFLGYEGGKYKFSFGDLDNFIKWNGTDLILSDGLVGPGNLVPFGAGDLIDLSNDQEKTTTTAQYPGSVKVKEIRLARAGTLRIKFDMKCQGGEFDNIAYGIICRNGNTVGTLRSTTSGAWTTYSEDIGGWEKYDLIQLYIAVAVPPYIGAIKNFRLYTNETFVSTIIL